jgi:hypothetical protein
VTSSVEPTTHLGEWLDVGAADVADHPDAIDRMYAKTLDGLSIRGVVEPSALREAMTRLESHADEFHDHGEQVLYGTALVGAADDRSDYLGNAWRINDRLPQLFDFDLPGRVAGVLSAVGQGRPASVPTEGPGRDYVPATIRILNPGVGVMHGHTGNEFCSVWPAYRHLQATARLVDSLSWFVVAEAPEDGGALTLYDLLWERTPDDIADLTMSEERDELLDRYPQVPIRLEAGDMILFCGGRIWHRVAPVRGSRRRVTIGGFAATSLDDREIYFWS